MQENSLLDILIVRAGASPLRDILKVKRQGRYQGITWQQFHDRVRDLALGLHSIGLVRGDRLAILSRNRPEWLFFDFASMAAGAVSIPLYSSSITSQVDYILKDSGARFLVAEDKAQMAKAESSLRGAGYSRIIVIDPVGASPEAHSMDEVAERGRELHKREPGLYGRLTGELSPDNPLTIIYTSGTTGAPKGAVLTHRNFMAGCWAARQVLPTRDGDVALSLLPLAHAYERFITYSHLDKGVVIAFGEGPEAVMNDMREVAPTVVFAVPRFFEVIRHRALTTVQSGSPLRRALFFSALRIGRKAGMLSLEERGLPVPLAVANFMARRLVHGKLRRRLGGRIRFFVSGGAPLSTEVATFFLACGLPVFEGYGLTESAAVCSVNNFSDLRLGTVGKPCPAVQARVSEEGEVLLKGDVIFSHYHNNPEATAQVLVDGWLHTGDIGRIDEDGFLIITDRKKDIIVTASGQKVAPQQVEGILKTHGLIREAVVLGDGRAYLTALITLDQEQLKEWVKGKGHGGLAHEELCRHPEVQTAVEAIVAECNRELAPYQRVKRFRVLPCQLTMAAGELTPTLKVRRTAVLSKYQRLVDEMYPR